MARFTFPWEAELLSADMGPSPAGCDDLEKFYRDFFLNLWSGLDCNRLDEKVAEVRRMEESYLTDYKLTLKRNDPSLPQSEVDNQSILAWGRYWNSIVACEVAATALDIIESEGKGSFLLGNLRERYASNRLVSISIAAVIRGANGIDDSPSR